MTEQPAPSVSQPFHILAKPTGSACNLACDYCFFLRKAALYPGHPQRMSDDILVSYLEQLLGAHSDGDVAVAFQGGEPTLMGLDFFRSAVTLAEKHRRPGQTVAFSIQTNATLLDEEWAAFLADNRFLVGVSIDGPADVHDAYRHGTDGSPTHARVMQAIRLLDAAGAEWNALTTVSRASEHLGRRVYEFLRDEAGAKFIQFIPIVQRTTDTAGTPIGIETTERSISPVGYGRFLADVFDVWVARDVGTVFVQDFDVALAAWAGEGNPLCVHAPTCGRALALEFNGDLYSCDHFVDPEHLLGNIGEVRMAVHVDSEAQLAFGETKLDGLPSECERCDVRFACHGGCPKDRFVPSATGAPSNYLCEGYRAFFKYIDEPMSVMAGLLAADRAPAEIVGMLAERNRQRDATMAAAGRNDPCPCGSGRKFKQCHGAA